MAETVPLLSVDYAALFHNGVGCGWLLPLMCEASPGLSTPLFILDMEHCAEEFDSIDIHVLVY